MEKIIKRDLLTKEEFYPIRKHQVFASSRNRHLYHNKVKKELKASLSLIEKPLQTNYKILTELTSKKDTVLISKGDLMVKGYCFSSFTHKEVYDNALCSVLFNFILVESLNKFQILIIKK